MKLLIISVILFLIIFTINSFTCIAQRNSHDTIPSKMTLTYSAIQSNKSTRKFKIIPPFEAINIAESKVQIKPDKAQIVELQNGVRIEIPKNVFVDEKGHIVNQNITLVLKTFYLSPLDGWSKITKLEFINFAV